MNSKPKDIDSYIAGFPQEIQEKLQELRHIIQKAAPKTIETISYGMPAYKQNGMLVYFAANKNHIGFYPTSSPIIEFKKELEPYRTSKGAIQFPLDKALPKKLITQIVQYRMAEDAEKAKNKAKK